MSRWSTSRWGGGSGASGGSSGGGGSPTIPDASNQTGSAIPEGSIVSSDPTGPKRIQPFDAGVASAAPARYVGVVTAVGGIANGATGEVTWTGTGNVLFKAGLTLNDGDELYASGDTPGSGTNLADLALNPPPSGGVRHRLGVVVDSSAYDGVGNLLAECAFYPGQRREEP